MYQTHFSKVICLQSSVIWVMGKKGNNGKNCSHVIVKLFGKYVHYDRKEYETYKKNIDERGHEEAE